MEYALLWSICSWLKWTRAEYDYAFVMVIGWLHKTRMTNLKRIQRTWAFLCLSCYLIIHNLSMIYKVSSSLEIELALFICKLINRWKYNLILFSTQPQNTVILKLGMLLSILLERQIITIELPTITFTMSVDSVLFWRGGGCQS